MDPSIAQSAGVGKRRAVFARFVALALLCGLAPVALIAFAGAQARAQAPAAAAATPAAAANTPAAAQRNPDKLYLEADQIIYDRDHSTVTAIGNVVMYYKNRVLQADKVVYDRASKRVLAEGRVKLTDERHDVIYTPKFDLTEDFAAGFADSVEELAADKTRFTSPRIERSAGGVSVLNQAVYTACEPCKAHPELPPLWQIRAAKIIENQESRTIYFEQGWLDIFGVPIAYMPYMSAPDATVIRQTGVLTPYYSESSNYGFGIGVPYFLALAPNYDLTLTPIYYTGQGPAFEAVWRQRLENGKFDIRLSGVDQGNPSIFGMPPSEAGNLKFRGSAQTTGIINLSDKWTIGWDLNLFTDRWYLQDYELAKTDPSTWFFGDIVSSAYLRGQDGRAYFDLSGYGFMPTTAYIDLRQEPQATPTLDYHRTFALNPDGTGNIGGELSVDLNAMNVNREEALYQSVGLQQFDPIYNLYGMCGNPNNLNPSSPGYPNYPTFTPGRTSNDCLLRGIAGDYARATAQVSWQDKYVDPIGEVWQPFIFARASGASADLNTTDVFSYGVTNGINDAIPNYAQSAFFNGLSSGSSATAMPGVGLEYRYPFMSNSSIGQQVIEPIAQLIVRPNEVVPKLDINEDAQSLVFDTTNLFAWSKYSGYDRVEGGTRLNYGLQYTDNFSNGGHLNFVAGESIQLAGQNSYTIADAANTGLDSGLDKQYSDFVASETLQPFSVPISLTTKEQFDSSTFALARFDTVLAAANGPWSANLDLARYAAQPALGWEYPRQGFSANANYKGDQGFTVSGGVVVDMSRQYYDVPGEDTPLFYATGVNLGASYEWADCLTLKVTYSQTLSDPLSFTTGIPPTAIRDQTVYFQLTLRTLGDLVKASVGQSSTASTY